MSAEIDAWLRYAEDNLKTVRLCIIEALFLPAVQNAQQAAEKSLKALSLARQLPLRKTHSIFTLRQDLENAGIHIDLSEDECDLLDSIYLPSKYPLGGVLPEFEPDVDLAKNCLKIAEKTLNLVRTRLAENDEQNSDEES